MRWDFEEIYMKKIDVISSIVIIGFSIFVSLEAISMSLGTLRSPGPGLYPFILGLVLGDLALLLGFLTLFQRHNAASRPQVRHHAGQVWAIITTLLAYTVLLPSTGYVIATLLLLGSLFKVGGIRSWFYTGLLAVLFTVATEIFALVFGIPLPGGTIWRIMFPEIFPV